MQVRSPPQRAGATAGIRAWDHSAGLRGRAIWGADHAERAALRAPRDVFGRIRHPHDGAMPAASAAMHIWLVVSIEGCQCSISRRWYRSRGLGDLAISTWRPADRIDATTSPVELLDVVAQDVADRHAIIVVPSGIRAP